VFTCRPADLERLSALLTDPRPLDEKQNEVLLEVESRMAGFLERGLGAENEIVTQMDTILPREIKDAMPEELRQAMLMPREVPSSSVDAFDGTDKPLATWTITSMDEEDGTTERFYSASMQAASGSTSAPGPSNVDDEPPASAATVAASQAAAELVEIQSAVMSVREQLSTLQSNADASKIPMIKLNLREAAQSLNRRLDQRSVVADNGADSAATVAVEEARALLIEVEGMNV
jgi:hypothetical protein